MAQCRSLDLRFQDKIAPVNRQVAGSSLVLVSNPLHLSQHARNPHQGRQGPHRELVHRRDNYSDAEGLRSSRQGAFAARTSRPALTSPQVKAFGLNRMDVSQRLGFSSALWNTRTLIPRAQGATRPRLARQRSSVSSSPGRSPSSARAPINGQWATRSLGSSQACVLDSCSRRS